MRVVDLFCGCGGLSLGLSQAGFEHELLLDIDKDCIETIKLNCPHWNTQLEDVRNISLTEYIDIDLLTGGIPCQSFSNVGKGKGFEDERGSIFFDFVKRINEAKPKVFLLENVKGLVTHNKGNTLSTILSSLREVGYYVNYKLLNAVDYSVPQKRERIIILGVKEDLSFPFIFPSPVNSRMTLRDTIMDSPISEGFSYSENKRRVLEQVPLGGCWRDLPENVQKEYMKSSYYSGGGKTGIARRLSWDEPSLTLTCSPIQKQTERCHPSEPRPLTVREYARIQTFPDSWRFSGSTGSKYKQIGNAIPVNFAYFLGQSVREMLEHE